MRSNMSNREAGRQGATMPLYRGPSSFRVNRCIRDTTDYNMQIVLMTKIAISRERLVRFAQNREAGWQGATMPLYRGPSRWLCVVEMWQSSDVYLLFFLKILAPAVTLMVTARGGA